MDLNQQDTTVTTTTISDACPEWAASMIAKILLLEVEAGTIKNPSESLESGQWSSSQIDDLSKMASRMDNQGYQDLADEVESLFVRVARGLVSEGHSPDAISEMVNRRIPTGCRLPYCSAAEVRDALVD